MDVGEESRRILVNELTGIGEWMTLSLMPVFWCEILINKEYICCLPREHLLTNKTKNGTKEPSLVSHVSHLNIFFPG